MKSQPAKDDLVEDLSGPRFCQSPDLSLDTEEVQVCQNYIKIFIPLALDVLFDPENADVQGICFYYYDGICPFIPPL